MMYYFYCGGHNLGTYGGDLIVPPRLIIPKIRVQISAEAHICFSFLFFFRVFTFGIYGVEDSPLR